MALNIYIGEKNLPEGTKFIKDADAFFSNVVVPVEDFSKKVIKEIDQGDLISSTAFIDRFGYKLWLNNCSTGAKIVLDVMYSDRIILADEMGSNCDELLLNIPNGQVYFTGRTHGFAVDDGPLDVYINGVHCSNEEELLDVMDIVMEEFF